MVEGTKSESTRLKSGSGSLLWLAGCVVLILSYTLPPVLIGGLVNLMIKNMSLAEIVVSLSSEAAFYAGVAAFLIITDRVQRPYMQTSPRRWSLINGLRGYSLSTYIATGLKIVVPLFAVYISWSDLGLDGLITVAPILLGCLTQLVFEVSLRMYQVNRAVYYIERLVYAMGEVPKSPHLLERGDTLVGMVVILQALGLVCLWCLITFLVRLLFPCTLVVDDGK
ncbi:hypothetical protein V2J09_007199 [Rumex salicifolius]